VLIAKGTNAFAGNSINLAVPRLMAHFGTDLAETQWVSTSFQIARTLVVPILGWLGASSSRPDQAPVIHDSKPAPTLARPLRRASPNLAMIPHHFAKF
jgi:hypothetical protein